MSAGLIALLDDVAAIAKAAAASIDDVAGAAAKASGKAVGVVVDDTAVTPQYVTGITPARELPIIAKIARGSLVNKAIILVVSLTLSHFLPGLLTPILMVGGTYLCFEGAEKILGHFFHHEKPAEKTPAVNNGPEEEKRIVSGAVRTDLILSTEIMVISLNELRDETLGIQIGALVTVAIVITVLVYGVVALLVKMDDIGLAMSQQKLKSTAAVGRLLLRAMPVILKIISVAGVAAMLWVGGHLFVSGLAELGFHPIHDFMLASGHAVGSALTAVAGAASWLTETVIAMIFGFVLGAVVVLVVWGVGAISNRIKG